MVPRSIPTDSPDTVAWFVETKDVSNDDRKVGSISETDDSTDASVRSASHGLFGFNLNLPLILTNFAFAFQEYDMTFSQKGFYEVEISRGFFSTFRPVRWPKRSMAIEMLLSIFWYLFYADLSSKKFLDSQCTICIYFFEEILATYIVYFSHVPAT